jgi:hypothetical protein
MLISRFYTLLKIFCFFVALVIAEYFACSVYFRFIRDSDYFKVDWICALSSLVLCHFIFRKLIRGALREKIPVLVIAGFFLFFTCLLGLFLRFSLQLANGWLDYSEPETRVVIVSDKKISSFGGSIKEGMNPMAHMIYFHDWDDYGQKCGMLTPQDFYYDVDIGTNVELTLRQGFFHWPWVEDYQAVKPRLNPLQPYSPAGI